MLFIQNFLTDNWQHRSLIRDLVKRDYKVRYLGSILGSYWSFLHPLAMMGIYTVIFGHVMKARIGEDLSSFSYTLYLCAGLLPWTNFTENLMRGTNVFFEYAHLIKKVSFPKSILALVVVLSGSIVFLISMALYGILLLLSGHGVSLWVLLFPIIYGLQCVFVIGLSLVLSVCNVFFRDVQQFLNILIQIWFWLTPIIYIVDRLPVVLQKVVALNPFYYFARAYQNIFFFQTPPDIQSWCIMIALALGVLLLGSSMLMHFKNDIIDEL